MPKKNDDIEEKEPEEKLYETLPVTHQLVFNDLALKCEGYFCDKLYYIIEATICLLADVPELEDELKKKFPEGIKLLQKFQTIASDVKSYYDGLDGGQITKNDISSDRFILFQDAMSDLPLINKEIYSMFYYIFKKTHLKEMLIPNEYFARAERKYKTFEPKQEIDAKKSSEDNNDDEDDDLE